MEREGKRKEIVDKFGFDVKYASHNWRLGNQCIQIMKEGFLNPTMEGEVLKICKDIRSGIYNKEQALKLMEEIDIKMYDAYKESKLPETPDFHKMNDFLVKLYKEYISGANIQEIEQITTNEQYKDVVQLIQGK
jgi:hypothetical protein